MGFRVESSHFDGEVLVLVPDIFRDDRGFFTEAFRADQFRSLGLPSEFVQENHSGSRKHVIRGLHFQWDPPMGKLMRVTRGIGFLVAVDIRRASPTVGRWVGVEVSEENRRIFWAPAHFARGFCALSDGTEVQYLCTGIYNSRGESAIRWDDPEIGIDWPVRRGAILSEKDRNARTLAHWLSSSEAAQFEYQREPAGARRFQ